RGGERVWHPDHCGRRNQVLRRYDEGARGRRECMYDGKYLRRMRREPGNIRAVSGKKVQGIPRNGLYRCDGERKQRPLFPGEREETCSGRRGRTCRLQGNGRGYCIPAYGRTPLRYGLLRNTHRGRTAAERQIYQDFGSVSQGEPSA